MTTATKSRKRVKPERRVRLALPIREGNASVLVISVGKDTHVYSITRLPSDFGAAFQLTKGELRQNAPETEELQATARYDVCLNGERSTCECKGFLHHGHCKHVDGLTTLHQRNLI